MVQVPHPMLVGSFHRPLTPQVPHHRCSACRLVDLRLSMVQLRPLIHCRIHPTTSGLGLERWFRPLALPRLRCLCQRWAVHTIDLLSPTVRPPRTARTKEFHRLGMSQLARRLTTPPAPGSRNLACRDGTQLRLSRRIIHNGLSGTMLLVSRPLPLLPPHHTHIKVLHVLLMLNPCPAPQHTFNIWASGWET